MYLIKSGAGYSQTFATKVAAERYAKRVGGTVVRVLKLGEAARHVSGIVGEVIGVVFDDEPRGLFYRVTASDGVRHLFPAETVTEAR